ncbi:alpha/beta hydrolase [Formosa sp. S-31]|uniref:alpha/beta hydrolase n=1 Tax=Formosa sp. S-31 TaxID=2790949 RepID=UPI003EBE5757
MKGLWLLVLFVLFSLNSKAQNIEALELPYAQISSGKLFRVSKFPSEYITPRTVDVWLPEGYSRTKKYAVLYMHDGQMLFDTTVTWNHQEWMVDEVSSQLMKTGKVKDFIVVAIHNISGSRYADLFPEKAIDYLNASEKTKFWSYARADNPDIVFNGDNYLKYLVKEIKPFVDKVYSTLPDRENTFVAGSSMGGLMSWYAICEYPEIFGGAACISTHWPGGDPEKSLGFPKAFFEYINAHMPVPETHKLYFDFGTETLDKYYPAFENSVNQLFLKAGYHDSNFKNLKYEGADHSELSWQKRLDVPLRFLLKP